MESINLNLIPTGANPVVHVSQYDTGRVIRFNIFEGSSVYFLDGTETISCNIKKPDNNIVTLSVTNTNDSYVEITTTEQATACDGSNLCEISITKGDDVIGSLNFIMEVERSPIEGGISSASEINNLWTQVDGMVADILADSYDSANVIFDNLPMAGHGIPYTVTSEGIGNAIDNALEMTDTASGVIATFESEYALPLRDLEIEINAVQEAGTPTPSSPKAISGFTGANIKVAGKNLYDSSTVISGKFLNSSGVETANASYAYSDYIAVKGGATYYYPSLIAGVYAVFAYDSSKTLIDKYRQANYLYTLPDNACYVRVNMNDSDKTTNFFNYPSTDTTYHPYATPTTTAISWQDEAGTVYGGSLDVTSGKLTVTCAGVLIDGVTVKATAGDLYSGRLRASIPYPSGKMAHYEGASTYCLCDKIVPDYNATIGSQVGSDILSIFPHSSGILIKFSDDCNVSDVASANTWLSNNNVFVVYELATPVTYQLTPTQISAIVGTNNVFTDTNGDTSLEYYTKRGEQTVRIAEGVAVDVINNKSIDTLTTTDKTVKGAINELDSGKADSATTLSGYGITNAYTKTEVDNALGLKFDDANRVTTGTGTFAGLLNTADRVWLITAQRLSTNSTLMLIAHKQNNNFYFKEIVKDTGMEYNYNSENGSVVVTYGGSTTGVYGGAYRLA